MAPLLMIIIWLIFNPVTWQMRLWHRGGRGRKGGGHILGSENVQELGARRWVLTTVAFLFVTTGI